MQCLAPLDAWRTPSGGVTLSILSRRSGHPRDYLRLPCGKCVHCVLEYRRQWTVRVCHEAQLYEQSCMITVTYDDAHLPFASSLCREDFQKFVKRLRKEVGDVRVFYCGEYGDVGGRPHYHAILFGFDFPDKEFVAFRGEFPVFRSCQLQRIWGKGRTEVGTVSVAGAAYVAGYVVAKLSGEASGHVDAEICSNPFALDRPFVGMSLKPGIGFWWFMRYYREVYPLDRVVLEGREQAPPRVYDKWLKELRPQLYARVKRAREAARVVDHPDDRDSRRMVIQEVSLAKVHLSQRKGL